MKIYIYFLFHWVSIFNFIFVLLRVFGSIKSLIIFNTHVLRYPPMILYILQKKRWVLSYKLLLFIKSVNLFCGCGKFQNDIDLVSMATLYTISLSSCVIIRSNLRQNIKTFYAYSSTVCWMRLEHYIVYIMFGNLTW